MTRTYPVLQELNPGRAQATSADSLASLIWLTLGAFAIGTEGFMIAGLLPALARDLNVGLPAAGHLVTAFSLAYAIGAPVMAVLTAGLERRRLLVVAMGGFALSNLLAALAPSYAGLLAARLLLALSAASFMPTASGYAAALGGPERRGRALSTITTGLTLAIIAGVPLGVLVGQGFGWRTTFFGVAGLSVLSLLGILARLPRQRPGVTAGLGERLALAKRRDILGVLMTSVLTVAGTFTVYTYLSVFIAGIGGLGPQALAPVLLGFGLASAVGTQLSGSASDHWGARSVVIVGGGLTLLAYLAFSLSAAFAPARAMPLLLPAILIWGFASWGLITAQQARLVTLAPALAPISLSMNSSAIYLGSAMGAAAGAVVIANGAVERLGWVAAGFAVAALLSVLLSGSGTSGRSDGGGDGFSSEAHHDHGSTLRSGFKQLRELVRRGGAMMSISGFAYRIGAVSNPRGMSAKAARGALRTAAVPLIAAAIALGASPAIAQDREQVKVAFAHALPNVEGKRLVAVTVTYPPGAKSLAHHHAASAFIYAYVLSGTIRSQVGEEPGKIYHAGESFYEMPGSHHRVSENASDKESASLLAVFVVDSKDEPLTTPDKAPGSQ